MGETSERKSGIAKEDTQKLRSSIKDALNRTYA